MIGNVRSLWLERFPFKSAQLTQDHQRSMDNIVRCILASRRTGQPILSVLVVGHASPEGRDDYNFNLARSALRRSQQTSGKESPTG